MLVLLVFIFARKKKTHLGFVTCAQQQRVGRIRALICERRVKTKRHAPSVPPTLSRVIGRRGSTQTRAWKRRSGPRAISRTNRNKTGRSVQNNPPNCGMSFCGMSQAGDIFGGRPNIQVTCPVLTLCPLSPLCRLSLPSCSSGRIPSHPWPRRPAPQLRTTLKSEHRVAFSYQQVRRSCLE